MRPVNGETTKSQLVGEAGVATGVEVVSVETYLPNADRDVPAKDNRGGGGGGGGGGDPDSPFRTTQCPYLLPTMYPTHCDFQAGHIQFAYKSVLLCFPDCPQQIELMLSGCVV